MDLIGHVIRMEATFQVIADELSVENVFAGCETETIECPFPAVLTRFLVLIQHVCTFFLVSSA
jgi:hypothetical protein